MRGQEITATRPVVTGCKEKIFSPEDREQWDRLPREMVHSPAVEVSRPMQIKALNNQDRPWSWSCCEQEVGLETAEQPSSWNHPMIFCSYR